MEARPYGVWGRWVREIQRYPSTDGGVGAEVGCAQNRRSRSTDGGAPGTVRPTTCEESFRVANTLSVIERKGRRGRRPLRVVREDGFQRSREV